MQSDKTFRVSFIDREGGQTVHTQSTVDIKDGYLIVCSNGSKYNYLIDDIHNLAILRENGVD